MSPTYTMMNRMPKSSSPGEIIEEFVRIVRGRYKPDIVISLGNGVRRFGELRRAIPHISERALARQLDALEKDGIVNRVAYPEIPPRVQYSLTAYGRTMCPILKSIWKWGNRGNRRTEGN